MKSIKITLIIYTCLFFSENSNCQFKYEPVFPTLKGQELFEEVQQKYKPTSVIEYGFARDTLFLKIDAIERNLSCIYTGLTLFIPPGSDPTQAVFLNGSPNGINTEHAYPQSLGTENNSGKSDMHHLYPSRVKTNTDRGILPFGEVNDNETKRWYLNNIELTSKPTSNIDAYTELGSDYFEPRENVKGDIARSMFYIYTIYNNEVNSVDNTFFEKQRKVLCDWHYKDVVDEIEWTRTQKIKVYQGNENPFVLDCSLAARLYCENLDLACKLLSNQETMQEKQMIYDHINSTLIIKDAIDQNLIIYNSLGQKLVSTIVMNDNYKINLEELNIPNQLLFAELRSAKGKEIVKLIR